MDSSDDFTPIDDGLHPAARHRSAFYVPSPPDDEDLLVSSTAFFSTSLAAPLASWLEQLAVQQLQSAATAAERLRANLRGPVPPPLAPPPPRALMGCLWVWRRNLCRPLPQLIPVLCAFRREGLTRSSAEG